MSRSLAVILAVATLSFGALAAPAVAQSRDALARHFKAYLSSLTYSSFLADKVLAYDRAMPPRCNNRKLTGDRRLFSVTELPAFIKTRKVPIAGAWAERVQVERCGRKVWHNVYMRATKKRGLNAVVGFPGHSLTSLSLQFRAGRAFLIRARKVAPKCKRFDIVATRVAKRPARRGGPWTEIWTAWVCGRMVTRPIRFVPRGKRVAVEIE
jgi:hypothetical protein